VFDAKQRLACLSILGNSPGEVMQLNKNRFRPTLEVLETRELMAASLQAVLGADSVRLEGTPDTISVRQDAGQISVVGVNVGTISGPRNSAALGSPTPVGLVPHQVGDYYGLNQVTLNNSAIKGDGSGQTIAIVDAYIEPHIITDLLAFDAKFGLPDPPHFTAQAPFGSANAPLIPSAPGQGTWGQEIALDVEWADAMAPGANIVLAEAKTNNANDLSDTIQWAARIPGVSVVSMSFGLAGISDSVFTTSAGHAPVTFITTSGDHGVVDNVSSKVLIVGGTTFSYSPSGAIIGETAWSGSGGGVGSLPEPGYQRGVQNSGHRLVPDVAYDAGTGVAVCDSWDGPNGAWFSVGGTSAGAPQWAALIAIADQGRALNGLPSLDGPSQTLPLLYHLPGSAFNDITAGANSGGFQAGPGYDMVTGLGSPRANQVVSGLDQLFTSVGGSLYLVQQGNLSQYDPTIGWKSIATNVQSFALANGGSTLYALGSDGTLYHQYAGIPFSPLTANVANMIVATGGNTLYVLNRNNSLFEAPAGPGDYAPAYWTPARTSVQVVPDGTVYFLTRDGSLYNANRGILIMGGVQSFSTVPDGTVYLLTTGGNLYNANRGILISGGVQSFSTIPDGTVYCLTTGGNLYNANRGILISGGVQSFSTIPDGTVYCLTTGGNLYNANRGILISGGVQSFSTIPDGTVYLLTTGGNLYNANCGILIMGGVQSFSTVPDGTVYLLTTSGNLYNANRGILISGGVASFGVGADGGVSFAVWPWPFGSGLQYYADEQGAIITATGPFAPAKSGARR
jgi:hypothetical protein